MTITYPEQKKQTLMQLIDDMTAAAIDHSSHGYTMFLQCRQQLVRQIDEYMKEDQERIDFAVNISNSLNKIFRIDCTNNRT